jgi:hypothetical protein
MAARRLIPAALLFIEGLGSAIRLTGLLPTLVVYSPLTLTLLAARALIAALQFTSGWMLWDDRPPARPLAIVSLTLSTLLAVPETGLRLAPTNIDPTFRWWAVIVYAMYASTMIWCIRKPPSQRSTSVS